MTLVNLNNVTLNFRGSTRPALQQINYEIKHGDFVILLGSNGSGKSTLLKLLHRFHHPCAGQIHFLNKPLLEHSIKDFSQHVAVLTQNCADSVFQSLTLYENYLLMKPQHLFSPTVHTKERTYLQTYLHDFNPQLTHKLDATVEQLSGGEKQALALAFCLLNPPSLLLLDEHTSALDPKTSEQIMELTQKKIDEYAITCILTTHNLDIAMRYGSRILMLHEGKILKTFDKKAGKVLSKDTLLKSYY